jgi:hypothetical protein
MLKFQDVFWRSEEGRLSKLEAAELLRSMSEHSVAGADDMRKAKLVCWTCGSAAHPQNACLLASSSK